MSFLEDIIALLESASVGTQNVNIFASTKAAIPKGNGPYLSIVETGGTSPDYIQNQILPAYHKPTAQLTCRAVSYSSARSMLANALNAMCAVNNQTVNGTFYQSIRPMQEIGDRGLDLIDRPTVGVNVIAEKV
jgi:hypothetical protein